MLYQSMAPIIKHLSINECCSVCEPRESRCICNKKSLLNENAVRQRHKIGRQKQRQKRKPGQAIHKQTYQGKAESRIKVLLTKFSCYLMLMNSRSSQQMLRAQYTRQNMKLMLQVLTPNIISNF